MSTLRNFMLLSLLFTFGLLPTGCSSENPCDSAHCEVVVRVAHKVDFALETEEGVSKGFNLDRRVSEPQDSATCGHGDMMNPEGKSGVDNTASVLYEAINMVTEASIEQLIRNAINEGKLILVFELFGVDDLKHDDCVDIEFFQAVGTPFIGSDDFIVPGQTFDVDDSLPRTAIKCATIRDGALHAGPFDGEIFVSILGVEITLGLHSAQLSSQLTEDDDGTIIMGPIVLGTGIEKEELHSILDQSNDGTILGFGHFLIDSLTDMAPDEHGECQQMSTTMLIDTSSAYLF